MLNAELGFCHKKLFVQHSTFLYISLLQHPHYRLNGHFMAQWKSTGDVFLFHILGNGYGIDKQVALQELSTFYVSSHVVIRRLGSIAFSAEKRLDYLSELIEKYGALDDIPHYANSFICLSASSHYPITEDEKK